MKAEHVNPFIISVCKIMKDMCMLDLKFGKPAISKGSYAVDASIIKLGIIGNLEGQVLLNIEQQTALEIVSKMMMTPVSQIDALGESAISELGNMIAGNAATVFSNNGVLIDITTPTYFAGADFKLDVPAVFSIPFTSPAGNLTVDVYIKD